MITVGETNPAAAEVAFFLPLTSSPGVPGLTGHVFSLGEVKLCLPGGSFFSVATSQIVEKGFGRYCVQLTAAQCLTAGDVYVNANVSGAQPYNGDDVIGVSGGDFAVNTAGYIPFFLANASNPVYGTPIEGHSFTAGEVKLCLPGGAYANANTANIIEIGLGSYALQVTCATRGKAFIYASVSGAQHYESFVDILNASSGAVPAITPPAIPSVPYVPGQPQLLNHVTLALARLPQQFAESPNIIALITALCGPIQILEQAQYQLLTMRSIATGQGVQLDAIGALVGRTRQGATDALYKTYLYAQVLVNHSGGTSEELIAIANAILSIPAGHIWIRTQNDASFILEIRDSPVTSAQGQVLQAMLTVAVDAGVRIVIVYSRETLANTFCFDTGPGLDQGHLAAGVDYTSTTF